MLREVAAVKVARGQIVVRLVGLFPLFTPSVGGA
jgi:hypothetical protein